MKLLGKGDEFDKLEVSLNRAAEAAMPEAKQLLIDAVKNMSVQDAKGILAGGDDAVTRFFRSKTEGTLSKKFLPVVKNATDRVGLARQYNKLAGQAASFGVIKSEDDKIENYVTRKALDGLFPDAGRGGKGDSPGSGWHRLGPAEEAIQQLGGTSAPPPFLTESNNCLKFQHEYTCRFACHGPEPVAGQHHA